MREVLIIEDREYEFLSNSGTAIIYKHIFKSDLIIELDKVTKKKKNIEKAEALESIERLAFVMNIQATKGFREIYNQTDEVDFLEWISQFEEGTFYDSELVVGIIRIWNNNTIGLSESKNLASLPAEK